MPLQRLVEPVRPQGTCAVRGCTEPAQPGMAIGVQLHDRELRLLLCVDHYLVCSEGGITAVSAGG